MNVIGPPYASTFIFGNPFKVFIPKLTNAATKTIQKFIEELLPFHFSLFSQNHHPPVPMFVEYIRIAVT